MKTLILIFFSLLSLSLNARSTLIEVRENNDDGWGLGTLVVLGVIFYALKSFINTIKK